MKHRSGGLLLVCCFAFIDLIRCSETSNVCVCVRAGAQQYETQSRLQTLVDC